MIRDDAGYAFVTPHGRAVVEVRGWTTRPVRLALALIEGGDPVTLVARTAPWRTLRALRRVRWRPRLGVMFETRSPERPELTLLEHPMPAGFLEHAAVARALCQPASRYRAVVVSDPRAASVLECSAGSIKVFDAYDAWDLSPLFAARPRLVEAICRGYRTAAKHADLVIANTPFMAQRMLHLGAEHVELLPNGAPNPHERTGGRLPNILYLGNIQRRLRIDLLAVAADAARAANGVLRIVGDVQDEPDGWARLVSRPDVEFVGPLHGEAVERELAAAAVGLVPHHLNDYSRSQDAMKAWEYLAAGMAIVSTSVPPAISVPGLARVSDDPAGFGAEVASALTETASVSMVGRNELAKANTWRTRADRLRALVDVIALER